MPAREIRIRSGYKMHYVEVGTGRPVILIHGLLHSLASWRRSIPKLSGNLRVLAVDLIGHGDSDKPEDADYTVTFHALTILQFMEAMDIIKASLVGHALGAAIALKVASMSPLTIEKIVLANPLGLRPIEVPGSLTGRYGIDRLLRPLLWRKRTLRRVFLKGLSSPRPELAIDAESFAEKGLAVPILALARSLRQFPKDSMLDEETFTEIESPCLVLWGSGDRILPLADADRFRSLVKGTGLRYVDGAGHYPQLERPDEFNGAVLEFIGAGTRERGPPASAEDKPL